MSATYGPRFSGGYQFPRTNAAPLHRGEAIREENLGAGARAWIVPLLGGRRKILEVGVEYEDEPGHWVLATCHAYDELEAREVYVRYVRKALRS